MCLRFRLRKPISILSALLTLRALNGVVFACSGPHVDELIEKNHSIVNAYGLVTILIFVAIIAIYFVQGRTGIFIILLALLVGFFHPIWYYGGGGGDCGQSFVKLTKYVTMGLGGIFLLQMMLWQFRRRARKRKFNVSAST